MTTPKYLALLAAAIEAKASISTAANADSTGYWMRIALAAEAIAGAATAANLTLTGWQKRAAAAIAVKTGISGAGYNANEAGYLAWMIAGLEFLNSSSTVGSFEKRLYDLITAWTVSAGAVLATPTLTNFSALGAAPVVLTMSSTDTFLAGARGQLQISTENTFTTGLTQNIIFFIDGASFALGNETIGLVSPTGAYFARARTLIDDENGVLVTGNDPLGNALSFNADVSNWSNTFTDTIVTSVAAFPTSNGVDKNANIATSGSPRLSFLGSGGVGAYCSTRVQVEAQSDFTQWEVTLTQVGSSDNLYAGFGTSADSFVGFVAPGLSDSTGVCLKINATTCNMNWGGDTLGGVLSSGAGTAQVGDTFSLRLKKSTNQFAVFRTRAGSTVQMGTTQTIPSFASYFAFVSTKQNWGGTCNFGASAFARTLGGGEAFYG